MKKIVFIFLLSGLCLNVFSQDNIPVVNDSVSKKGMESTDSIDNRISKDTTHVDGNASVSKMENDSTNSIVEAITPSKSECNEFKAMADKLDLIHKEIQERRNDDNQELEEANIKWEAKFKDLEKTNGILNKFDMIWLFPDTYFIGQGGNQNVCHPRHLEYRCPQ